MDRLLLIDQMSLFYRALHVNSNLSHEGLFTGALYGFATQVCSTINVVRPRMVVVCKDTKPYLKVEDYPDFKANRATPSADPLMNEMVTQGLSQVDKWIQLSGIGTLEAWGLEADDLIAAQVKLRGHQWEVIAATSDSDMFQLFSVPGFKLYRGGEKGYYTRGDFVKEYDIDPRDWVRVIALTGGHNNLPKVPGVGEKTAIKIVLGEKVGPKVQSEVDKYEDRIQLNMKVAKLPYYKFRDWSSVMPKFPDREYSERKLMVWLTRHGIQFTSAMQSAMERIHRS